MSTSGKKKVEGKVYVKGGCRVKWVSVGGRGSLVDKGVEDGGSGGKGADDGKMSRRGGKEWVRRGGDMNSCDT